MNRHEWDLLLERYVSGECSPAEEAVVRQELAKRGESPDVIDALRAARRRAAAADLGPGQGAPPAGAGAAPPAEVTEALARLDQRLVDAGLRPAATPRLQLRLERERERAAGPSRRLRLGAPAYGLRAAAVACLLLGGAAAAMWLTMRAPGPSADEPAAAVREFATTRGQRAIFRLIDGTEVILSVDSRLRMPASYGATAREVYLEGEAYFTVAHQEGPPFVVRTAHGATRDIGTKFGVRAYRDDPAERVVVAEGAVAVAAGAEAAGERRLDAGQLALVSPGGAVDVVDGVDVDRELAWIRGELRFTNTPLGAAIRRLGQWYDVDVRLADTALASRPVSGIYAGEPLDQVLTLITAAVDARFERDGKRVVIYTKTGGLRP